MCGILGFIVDNNQQATFQEFKRMIVKVAHRGPDAEGYYIQDNLALGYRQLSILDLTEARNQLMNYCNDLVITYNGEIYNYLELREKLKTIGYSSKTATDTGVILQHIKNRGQIVLTDLMRCGLLLSLIRIPMC